MRGSRRVTWLVLGLWLMTVGTLTMWAVSGSRQRAALGEELVLNEAANGTRLIAFCIFAMAFVAIVVGGVRDGTLGSPASLVIVLTPWIYLFLLRLAQEGTIYTGMGLLYPVVAVALWVARPNGTDLRVVAWLSGLTLMLALALGAIFPGSGIAVDYTGAQLVVEKALTPWGLLQGMFTSGNNLGQFAAIALPMLWLIERPGWRFVMIAAAVSTLVWSSSRTALLTAAVSMLALALVWLLRRRSLERAAAMWLGVSLLAITAAILPLVSTSQYDFSGRGRIWSFVLSEVSGDAVFGIGTRWFDQMGLIANSLGRDAFHAHNQVLHLLVTGGFVLIVLVAILLWFVTREIVSMPVQVGIPMFAWLVAVLVAGMLEVGLGFIDRTNFFFVSVLPMIFIAMGRARIDRLTLASPVGVGVGVGARGIGAR